jgi:hypothetical protein
MANPDLCSLGKTRTEGFGDGSGILPAHAAGDVHLPDVSRRDAKMRLERGIDLLIDEAASNRRPYREEKIG